MEKYTFEGKLYLVTLNKFIIEFYYKNKRVPANIYLNESTAFDVIGYGLLTVIGNKLAFNTNSVPLVINLEDDLFSDLKENEIGLE
jgi:hypothetical protein